MENYYKGLVQVLVYLLLFKVGFFIFFEGNIRRMRRNHLGNLLVFVRCRTRNAQILRNLLLYLPLVLQIFGVILWGPQRTTRDEGAHKSPPHPLWKRSISFSVLSEIESITTHQANVVILYYRQKTEQRSRAEPLLHFFTTTFCLFLIDVENLNLLTTDLYYIL